MQLPGSPPGEAVSAPLERLPAEILQRICEYVASCDHRRRPLFAFSMTSKLYFEATKPQRFASIRLTIENEEKLRKDLDHWNRVLNRNDSLHHVRHVTVIGYMKEEGRSHPNGWRGDIDGDSDNEVDDTLYTALSLTAVFTPSMPCLTLAHKNAQKKAWLPFARLLGRLRRLTDLVYACSHQMPRCVLDVLHQCHPKSRLHIHAFSLRSLYEHPNNNIDPDEFALITSPCLYSIDAKCMPQGGEYNWEAVAWMVSGLAPALRRVRLDFGMDPLERQLKAIQSCRPTWLSAEYPWDEVTPRLGLGRLDLLSLFGNVEIEMKIWNSVTDFGVLRRLELQGTSSVSLLHTLASMARENQLRSLRELRMNCFADQPTAELLLALLPLEVLALYDCLGRSTFEALLDRHGQTLSELALHPEDEDRFILSHPEVRQIQQRCPKLQKIDLTIHRHQGGPEEVAIYRALGQLARLTHATLVLECGSFDKEKDPRENLRKILINAAMDKSLALAIFREMSATSGAPLQRLRLEMSYPMSEVSGWEGLDHLLDWVARDWVCEKYGRGVTGHRIFFDEWAMEDIEDDLVMAPRCVALWADIWPRKTGDWKRDWSSFPLSVQAVEEI